MNTPTRKTNTLLLADLMANLIAGEPLPVVDSPEWRELEELIRRLQKDKGADYEMLGMQCLGALIEACRAKIATEEVLRDIGDRT